MKLIRKALTAAAFSLVLSPLATLQALTLDEFLGDGVASSSGNASSAATLSSSAVGGVRTLYAIKNSAGPGLTRIETFPDPEFTGDSDYSLGYTQGGHTGLGIVSWDGDSVDSIVPNGLGSIDLTQDDGSAIRLGVKFFDFPATQPIDITIRLYDATNLVGIKFSDVTVTLAQAVNSAQAVVLTIPLSLFTTAGSGTIAAPEGGTLATLTTFGAVGAVDVTKVGAIQLMLNGLANSNAPDLTLDFLTTNGRCSAVPDSQGRVVDDCGLCPDAANFNKAKDICGVCSGDGTSCLDCQGVPFGLTALDACGTCGGNKTDPAQCDRCVIVKATKEVKKFEKELLAKATQMYTRYKDEANRAAKNKCAISLTRGTTRVKTAHSIIRQRGQDIFRAGVEVCGDSCVTVSYADQVTALNPQFRIMEKETVSLANRVKNCFKNKGLSAIKGTRGVAVTVANVRRDLDQLVEECRNSKVCPPK